MDGRAVRYLIAGEGPPLVLLHALGDNALDWSWVMPELSRDQRLYAPDLPGIGDGGALAGPSPPFLANFVASFLDSLGVERAAVVGNSYGGLVALRLALSEPGRVSSLGLVGAAGLGLAVCPVLSSLTLPGYGEASVAMSRTILGARQRARGRAALLFARPGLAPPEWLSEQYRLARTPGFLEATLCALRSRVAPWGQREVLLERLPDLAAPTLVVWGARDRIFPLRQARDAAGRLEEERLRVIPACGHLPQVERPGEFAQALGQFLEGTGCL